MTIQNNKVVSAAVHVEHKLGTLVLAVLGNRARRAETDELSISLIFPPETSSANVREILLEWFCTPAAVLTIVTLLVAASFVSSSDSSIIASRGYSTKTSFFT